jgi:glycosyltransferase involved in cell wall biosynthesis
MRAPEVPHRRPRQRTLNGVVSSKPALSVLMFCPQFRPHVGGAERQAEKLAVALDEAGCRVTILTPRLDRDSPDSERVNQLTIERFPLTDLSRRFPVPGVAVLNIPYIVWQIARAAWPRLQGVDVLHCHLASLQTAGAALAARLANVPMLCKAATADHRSDLGEMEKTGVSGPLVAWLVRTFVQTWVATTAAVEAALIRAGVEAKRIVRIPNGVELPDCAKAADGAGGVRDFLYMGRLSANARRDLPTLVRAFDRVAAVYPDLQLAIVGGGDLLEETRRLAETCTSRHRIHVPGLDLPEKWIAWADCFVLPSRREGLSNALLEAMAAGLPCIANDIPSNREVLDDGNAGVLVPVEDCDALEAAMRAMVEDERKARRFAEQARERVERCYSIRAVAKRYMHLYGSLLSQ